MGNEVLECRNGEWQVRRGPNEFLELPFVYRSESDWRENSNWHVPHTDDYARACAVGREYAEQFIDYLRGGDATPGDLWHIMRGMNLLDDSPSKGYRVGFFAELERRLV